MVGTFVNLFASQTNYDIKNTILVVGSTRSGTTFLMESLNAKNEYRLIFEPFNSTYVNEWRTFSARHYIDPESFSEVEKKAVDQILRGKVKNLWVDRYNRRIKSEKRLIKAVRANLLLDYIEKSYPHLTIIYIYRNPLDVIASRINLNFDPNDVDLILNNVKFISKYYSHVDMSKLKSLLVSPEARHAALWCLENEYLLKSLDRRKLLVTRYEDIVGKSVEFMDGELYISNEVRKPSVTSSLTKAYSFTESEIHNINTVLELFGLKDRFS